MSTYLDTQPHTLVLLCNCCGFVPSVNPYPIRRPWENGGLLPDMMFKGTAASGPGLKETGRVRTEFPETWLWSDVTMGYT